MIYVEYISRRPGIALDDFHRVVRRVQEAWEAGHSSDRLILNAGRTWRLGPPPEYLGIWDTGTAGLERLDAWARAFRERGNVGDETTMERVARIDAAGCYRALDEPVSARGKIYYVENFIPSRGDGEILASYRERARSHAGVRLYVLAVRIGRLAREPGGIAVWGVSNFGSLAGLASEPGGDSSAAPVFSAGVYADIGEEIL
jgi:hypothetical protein